MPSTDDVVLRVGSVTTDYGTAVVPIDAEWTSGWNSAGLPIRYDDGRQEIVPWTPPPPKPRLEFFGITG